MTKIIKLIFRPYNILITATAFFLLKMLVLVAVNISFLNPIAHAMEGFSTTDIYYNILTETKPDTCDYITIVDMTSLHNRDSIATLLEELAEMKPRAVDVDIVFEYEQDPEADIHLFSACSQLPNAVFSFKMLDWDYDKREFTRAAHSFFAKDLNLDEGFVNIQRNMVRDIPLGQEMNSNVYPSVVAQMVRIISGEDIDYNTVRSVPIDYTPTAFRIIPYDELSQNSEHIRNHAVLLGGAKETADMSYTPLGNKYGIEILAYGLKTIMEKKREIRCEGMTLTILSVLLVYLTSLMWSGYNWSVNMIGNKYIKRLLKSEFMGGIKAMTWMLILIILAFTIFVNYNYSIDLTLALSGIALLRTSGELTELYQDVGEKYWNKFLNRKKRNNLK